MQHGPDSAARGGRDSADSPPHIAPVTPPASWQRFTRWAGPVLALGLIVLAIVVLREVTKEITWAELKTAVAAVPPRGVAASMVFAMLAMGTMGLYDVLSCRIAGLSEVPARLAAIAGFCGYALANALGFHIILGGTVRYRIYSGHGISARAIAQILALSLGTIWLAIAALCAVVFLVEPMAVPLFGHAPLLTRITGGVIAVAYVALVIWLWPGRQGLTLLGWTFPVPDGSGAILQTILGIADFGLAAAALYVLVPGDLRPDFLPFALIFMTSFLAGTLSHSPGGLGVLEAGILLGLGAANRPDAIAALIVFRLTYYIVPFIVAVLALVLMEATRGHSAFRWVVRPVMMTLGIGLLTVVLFFATRKG